MHIPDGFLSQEVMAGCAVLAAGGIALSLKKTNLQLEDKAVPMMGILGAFIFAAQMVNFPVLPGTSGHLLGGALAAIVLGPWAASLILSSILIIQCFLFQDGGLIALGANIFNMSFIGVFCAYGVYKYLKKILPGKSGRIISVFTAGWISVAAGSFAVAVELNLSGSFETGALFKTILGIHFFIGLAEAVITWMVVEFLFRTRPDLITSGGKFETA